MNTDITICTNMTKALDSSVVYVLMLVVAPADNKT